MDEEQQMTHKILGGCIKVMIAHPEEKLKDVYPAVLDFMWRTGHFPQEERIDHHVTIQDLFKELAERKDVPLPMWSREEAIRNVGRCMARLSGNTEFEMTFLTLAKAPDQ